MPLIVYLDEAGDHTLELVDKEFPLFTLVLLICETGHYVQQVVPAFYQLKFECFGHEGVILHSRDIRKAQGDFGFLTNAAKRVPFYERLNRIMESLSYTIIASVIRKQVHKEKYGLSAKNPYDLALKFALERLLPLLEQAGQKEVLLVAEARGKREDDELRLSFFRVVSEGTEYLSAQRFKQIQFRLEFLPKCMNVLGTQMADLAAYPIARHVLDPSRPNPAYDIVAKKFYEGLGPGKGLKVFP